MTLDFQSLDSIVLEPRATASNHNDHFVELYEDDAALVESIRKFLSMGLNDGEPAVVIATGSHRHAIEAELRRTVDLDAARSQGLYTSLDARETLSLFLDGDEIDPARFERVIGGVLRAAGTGDGKIRVFGEMVALLWEAGNVTAALDLEDRWNGLAKSFDFRLFCAYPSAGFDGADTSPLAGVCNRHSHVVVPRR